MHDHVSRHRPSLTEESVPEYLATELQCQSADGPFVLISENSLHDRDRVTIKFKDRNPDHVTLEASAVGYQFEQLVSAAATETNARKIIAVVSRYISACEDRSGALEAVYAEIEENRERLKTTR